MECVGVVGHARCLACLVGRAFSGKTHTQVSILTSPIILCYARRNRSLIFFIVAILAYVWRYGSSADPASPPLLSPTAAIGPRVAISALFFLGLLYLVAIVRTLHSYGRTTDYRLFGGLPAANGRPEIQIDDTERRDRGSQRGRETSSAGDGNQDRESTRAGRGRERPQEATEPGGLSAVMGLGLTGLDEIVSARGSTEEMAREKQQQQTEATV